MCFTKRKRKDKYKPTLNNKRTIGDSNSIIIHSKKVQPKRVIKKITP